MDFLLSTKIKFILFFMCGCGILFLLYWIFIRSSRCIAQPKPFSFNVPADQVKKIVLDNGMHVLMFQNKTQPKVLVQIAYDIGSYVEESGEYGLAHLIEHMIFKGTQKLSETDIDSIARKFGATFNAFTSNDITSYFFEINKNNWKPFIEILADCMQNARFDKEHLASELKTVVQELKMYKDLYARSVFDKACQILFPPNHPYHMPIIGFKENLLALNNGDLKTFYNKYYQPHHATLFVVGDIDFNDVEAMARKHFEVIQKSPMAQEPNVTFPSVDHELMTHQTSVFEDVSSDIMTLFWRIPGQKAGVDHIVSAVENILGGGQAGRLYRSLVDEHKVASSVSVEGGQLMSDGIFLIMVEPLKGKREACEQLIKKELENIIAKGVEEEEITRVSRYKIRSFFETMQNFSRFTYEWLSYYFATRDELAVFKQVNKFADLKSNDISTFVTTYLDPFLANRIDILPIPENKKPLKEKRKAESDAIDLEILAKHPRVAELEEPKFLHETPDPALIEFSFPKPTKILELDNGLKIMLCQEKSAPLIALNCRFKDAAYLTQAKEGISVGIMMDMLIEGCEGYTKKEIVDFFEKYGASYSFSDQGATLMVLNQDFEALQERFFSVLTHPTFQRKDLEKVKHIFVDNFQRAKDSPKDIAFRMLKNEIFKNHPFAWTFDEGIELTKKITSDDLNQLHKTYVNPANMVISIVGDFEIDIMEKLMTKIWASWPSAPRKIIEKQTSSFCAGQTLDYYMVRDQVILAMGNPSTLTVYDPDLVPLKMLSIICFASLGSRLFKVREQTGLFYTAFGAFAAGASNFPGYDFIGAIVSLDKMSHAQDALKDVFANAVKQQVTQQEIDAAKHLYLKDLIDLVSSTRAIAAMHCILASLDLGFDYYDRVWKQIQTMTPEQIATVADKYVKPHALSSVRVGPVK